MWTDGSLITTPTETYQELHVGERVSVIWDDGWYCGTITHAHGDSSTKFRIQYDDGDTFWYQTSSTNDRVLKTCDEDGDYHAVYRSIPHSVGGAGAVIFGLPKPLFLQTPAGAVGSSFDAEVQAAQMAFRNVPSSGLGPATTIRWFTDSLSCIQALQSPLQAQQDSIRILWNIMETILSRGHHIQAVWIPSHCGIDGYEAADKLANKAAIQNSLVAQQTVPLSLQSAISIHKQRTAHQLIEIPELPPDLNHIPRRRAEVILHQLVCGSFSGVRAFYPPDASDHDTTCHMCTLSVPETVEHALLRCTGRSSSRRKLFGFLQRKERNIPFICRNYPINTLKFVDNEGLIKSP